MDTSKLPDNAPDLLRALIKEFYGGDLAHADAFRILPTIAEMIEQKRTLRERKDIADSEIRDAVREKTDELLEVIKIGEQLAGHVTRAFVNDQPLDRDVMRHWANRFHEAKRVWCEGLPY